MKSGKDKNKQKEDAHLLKAKELREKIESLKNDLAEKTQIINTLKEQRENKIQNIKQLEVENKANYEQFLTEYQQILNQYRSIEREILDVLADLKVLSERSYIQLRQEKDNILANKNLILEEKKKEFQGRMEKVALEVSKHSSMLNDVLLKTKEIFKKTHVQYQHEADLKPLLIRLQSIGKR
ncbi:conserved Plasmodium protein, unknown function [Plasmodium vivax]|uniref:Uncharacterized protein n=6 Tax=Plasmodium vivax TaxID=5855 RepID=A5K7J9_PLAVS|nr:hypothetical protein PVX_095085 [Plasmodium vivax]KMZ80904.1 hypothetical protein PVIIG_02122 [Plasmodium vivax India VII]KMZ87037.1 hypothetical protein PVBG_02878 [Plasmodium vivax Brazil I]KMZ93469.1 hypothetical protein PVMG_00915 [Plasmodium vivax Mauritania I]KNA00134.1 hypothetical protein PVNG_02130 [Plasmodium vivax North Korean]EDL44758.1 hypothetical protein PVX_095085 [Plasmodium vivax]|eukprot:XP_001614485.1 hypothetical protein [Plasmodium vivax Sal-1]